jgi:hypothetical protein
MKKDDKILLEKHKDIARIDQDIKRTHGWYVRVRYLGKTYSKFFSDRKCGGRYSSLLAALAWRDKTEAKLGKQRTNKHIVTISNSKTGVVGVRHKTSVSINKHGKDKAFEMACRIRKEKESERLAEG